MFEEEECLHAAPAEVRLADRADDEGINYAVCRLGQESGRVAELSMSCCWVVMETLGEDVVH